MMLHRSPTTSTPELFSRASLMVDGARMPLRTVAESLEVTEQRLAHLVALGRLRAADEVVVQPLGCGPHLAGLVIGDPATVRHVLGCSHCQALEESMATGMAIARARWTGQPVEAMTGPALRRPPQRRPPQRPPTHVPPPPAGVAVAATVPPPPMLPPPAAWSIPPTSEQDRPSAGADGAWRATRAVTAHPPLALAAMTVLPFAWQAPVTAGQRARRQRRWPARALVAAILSVGMVAAVATAPGSTTLDGLTPGTGPRSTAAADQLGDQVPTDPDADPASPATTSLTPSDIDPDAVARVAGSAPYARDGGVDVHDPATWERLAGCESGGDWAADTGNGFYGGLQFLPSSWQLVGGQGLPHLAPREEQISRAIALWQLQGWPAWPVCSRRLGYR